MVYCGKPSTGCQTCRDKKTRCDRLTPSCSQCIRAQRTCPGYRNQLDLMFRNESEAVIGKFKARQKSKATSRNPSRPATPITPPPSASSGLPPKPSENVEQEALKNELNALTWRCTEGRFGDSASSMIPSYSLKSTMQERGRGYFYSNSALWFQNSDLLSNLCSQANDSEHLLASMSAVGLASLSKTIHAPELLVRANRDYVTAIRLTNSALGSPTQVKKDSTLFAVIVLSMFETITGTDGNSIGTWTKHINGAAALVKLRGTNQFSSSGGQRMYLQVMGHLLLSCVQRTIPAPPDMIELRKEASKYMDTNTPAWKLTGIIIDFTIFRAKVLKGSAMPPRQLVKAALDIDQQFVDLSTNLPAEFSYQIRHIDKGPDIVWNGLYYEYENNWTLQIWNWTRVCRILLHETIRNRLRVVPSVFTDEEAASQNAISISVLLQAQTDILASVPLHISTPKRETKASILKGSREWVVLWPLYVVGAADLATDPIREWVIKRLKSIADSVGIAQGQVLAEYLIMNKDIAC